MNRPAPLSSLAFYTTPPHECSYLPNRRAITLFADPRLQKDARIYGVLSGYGFRRSGEHLYRPRCQGCQACVPVRVPVRDFEFRRRQRRTWEANRGLRIKAVPSTFNDEHFALYQRYVARRHPGGGMDNPTPQNYMDFITASWADTMFYEMRLHGQLLGVAVADHMKDAMSAVYTFFDPDVPKRSLGRFAVLYEIHEARRLGLKWLYLGYWIRQCRKMQYKNEYQPLEYYHDGAWTRVEPRS